MTIDVSRAYFYAPMANGDNAYVKLPSEDASEGMCGMLNYSMYGTRKAAHNWQVHFTGILRRAGFIPGRASPCTFHHPRFKVFAIVHGDDFVSTGDVQGLDYLRMILEAEYELKTNVIGFEKMIIRN